MTQELARLRWQVRAWRGVALSLAVVVVFAVIAPRWPPRTAAEPGETAAPRSHTTFTVDLPERLAATEREYGHVADVSETYVSSPDVTVHMHFMGHLQTTPLHLHPASEEVVIIAGGTAEVRQVWGAPPTTRSGTFPRHSVIFSGAFTGHEWRNPAHDRLLANLVITAPTFSGNFYVKPDDERLARGAPPASAAPAEALDDFRRSGAPWKLTRLPMLDGRLYQLLVARSWAAPATGDQPLLAYVAAGEGRVRDQALRPGTLLHLVADTPSEVTALPGQPLALVLIDLHRRVADAAER